MVKLKILYDLIKWPAVVPWLAARQWCWGVEEGSDGDVGKEGGDVGIGKGAVVWWVIVEKWEKK